MANLTRRGPLIPTIIVAGILVVGFLVFAEIWTDKLWFDSVSYGEVFSTQLVTKIVLFLSFFVIMAGIVGSGMWLAWRLRPADRRSGASAVLDRYRDLLGARLGWAILLPSAFFGVIGGLTAAASTMEMLAFLNRTPFGQSDPYFGLDVSFYVFELPLWRDLLGFLMSALFFGLIGATVVHFTTGGLVIGRRRPSGRKPSVATRHLSVLAALVLVVYGLQALLDRFGFLVEQGTLLTGLQYTDAHARLGAKLVIAVIAFICAGLFLLNAFLNRWSLPITGLALMLVSGLVLQLVYPAIVQSFQVRPNEPDKEGPYMQTHIDATRRAYGIGNVDITPYEAVTDVRPGQLKEDAAALPGVRLIDPAIVGDTFEQLQQVKGYYSFPTVLDVDRYHIKGVETDAVVAARELNLANGGVEPNWNNIHTVYTHGYGMVAASGNRSQSGGQPVWLERDLPPSGVLGEYESRIYFGESSDNFVIVGREPGQPPIEFDTPGGGTSGAEAYNTYGGGGGVPIGNWFTRLLYAAHFMDLNIILSDRVNSASQLLYDRTPKQRVAAVAPWLTLDQNTYPAVVDGRLVWILDGYTTSRSYPNSLLINLQRTTTDAQSQQTGRQADEPINYIRNSVKAIVDATDGSVKLYSWDDTDPILQSYSRAFPGTVLPKSDISPDLLAHLRYPEDLFKIQREVLGRYHVTNPATWYQQTDLWQVPADPVKGQADAKEPPYYLSILWPGDKEPVFSQTAVFVPKGRSNLASYLAVNAEASSPDYGKLRVLRMSDSHQIDGPGQTFNAMTTDTKVSDKLRPYLNQGSATASYGNLLTFPMGSGLLYVLPVYTQRPGNTGSYPVLTYVIARFGSSVGIGVTLQQALDQTFQGDSGVKTGETVSPTPSPTPTPTDSTSPSPSPTGSPTAQPTDLPTDPPAAARVLLQTAQDAFVAADKALREGNLSEYQRQVEIAKESMDKALKLLNR